jgi:hypothetical protein
VDREIPGAEIRKIPPEHWRSWEGNSAIVPLDDLTDTERPSTSSKDVSHKWEIAVFQLPVSFNRVIELDLQDADSGRVIEQEEAVDLGPMNLSICAVLDPLTRDIAEAMSSPKNSMNPLLILQPPPLRGRPAR